MQRFIGSEIRSVFLVFSGQMMGVEGGGCLDLVGLSVNSYDLGLILALDVDKLL